MILANSADSHLLEPADLWTTRVPARFADRAPRSEKTEKYETIYLDGERMYRALAAFTEAIRPPGATDLDIRLQDLDREGVRHQLAFPSMGFWLANLQDPELQTTLVRAWNDWAVETVIEKTDRVLPSAMLPFLSVDDAVAEVQRVKELGFRIVFLPTRHPGRRTSTRSTAGSRCGPPSRRPASCSASTSAPAVTRSCTADPVGRSSTTGRPRCPVSVWSPTSSRPARSIAIRTSTC